MRFIIALVATALVALLLIQLYWVRNAYSLREREFDHAVKAAMDKTAATVNENAKCFEVFSKVTLHPGNGLYIARQPWEKGPAGKRFMDPAAHKPDTVPLFAYFAPQDTIFTFNTFMNSYPMQMELVMKCMYDVRDSAQMAAYPLPDPASPEEITALNYRDKLADPTGIFYKVDTAMLDSLLHMNLGTAVPGYEFQYGITNTGLDSVAWASAGAERKALLASPLRASLLEEKYFGRPYFLSVYFPGKSRMVLAAMGGVLITSALVIILLVYAFWFFVRTIMRQKKLNEMKTDFINNMTHEFKTPITNISLAIETLNEGGPVVKINGSNRERILLNIIGEENNRMRENVERILQIAMLDREKIELEPEKVDVHKLLRKAGRTLGADLSQVDIRYDLAADAPCILGDSGHLLNIFYNLLDNAIKYSGAEARVTIRTCNLKEGIVVSFKDNGIGMDRETLKHIFEKFYRAHTGDVHNVKGFGLGLAYVKSIVEAHQGRVSVKSELGKGTAFELFLPFEPVFKVTEA